jgi:hypothetical protein
LAGALLASVLVGWMLTEQEPVEQVLNELKGAE